MRGGFFGSPPGHQLLRSPDKAALRIRAGKVHEQSIVVELPCRDRVLAGRYEQQSSRLRMLIEADVRPQSGSERKAEDSSRPRAVTKL
jgi:hypothetical protein